MASKPINFPALIRRVTRAARCRLPEPLKRWKILRGDNVLVISGRDKVPHWHRPSTRPLTRAVVGKDGDSPGGISQRMGMNAEFSYSLRCYGTNIKSSLKVIPVTAGRAS